MTERTPFPEINTADGTGYEWMGRFMEAHASVMANSLFATFKLGQIGAAGKFADKETARALLDDFRTDRADLRFATDQLIKVMDHLIANIEGNLA